MNRNSKGQVAIEFMMTYGWAILASMLVIGALAYFGITNPATTLPDKCTFSNAFQCTDYMIIPGETSVRLTNTLGQTIYEDLTLPDGINAFLTDFGDACTVESVVNGAVVPGAVETLEPEGIIQVVCPNPEDLTGDLSAGDKLKRKITVVYSKIPSGFDQVSLGEVYATVQGP